MVKATLFQHRGQLTPIEIRVRPHEDHIAIDMVQTHGKVEISSNDAEWLFELENAVRIAREHLETRLTLEVPA